MKSSNSLHYCELCNYSCTNMYNFNRHLQSNKHNSNLYISNSTTIQDYCPYCDYTSDKKFNMIKHLTTKKHVQRVQEIDSGQHTDIHKCHCGKYYKYRSSLTRHKRSCINKQSHIIDYNRNSGHIEKEQISNDKEKEKTETEKEKEIHMVLDGFKTIIENFGEKQVEILEQIKDTIEKPNVIINNTQNNSFSIIAYLNTHCKDAQNLIDYVNSMKVTNKDLEYIHNNTLMDSINTCFIEPITNMEQKTRPIHCTDLKRHKFMVKHDGVWQRDKHNKIISDSFHTWANKVGHQLVSWSHEDCNWSNDEHKLEMSNDLIRKLHLLRFDENTNQKVIQKMKYLKFNKLE